MRNNENNFINFGIGGVYSEILKVVTRQLKNRDALNSNSSRRTETKCRSQIYIKKCKYYTLNLFIPSNIDQLSPKLCPKTGFLTVLEKNLKLGGWVGSKQTPHCDVIKIARGG